MIQLQRALIGVILAVASLGAHAQASGDFPARTVRIVVPYPAGGPVDAAARQLAKSFGTQWRQTVIVENKPGASTTIGAAEVAKAPADGHTLLFSLPDSFTYVPQLFKRPLYDPARDLAPVSLVAMTQPVLVLRQDAPVSSLRQFGKGSPPMSFGSWGPGTYPHLIAAALGRYTGADINIVAYRGGAPAIQDFMGGHIHMTIAGIPAAMDMQKKGLAHIVAVGGTERSRLLPQVPTFAEQGLAEPTFALPVWVGLAAPGGTPQALRDRLQEAVKVALRDPEMQRFLDNFGWAGVGSTPADFAAALAREAPVVAEAMKLAGVQPE